MSAHTPEPWREWRSMLESEPRMIVGQSQDGICEFNQHNTQDSANLGRVLQCVNACAGIDDPATELARLRACEAALHGVVKAWSGTLDSAIFEAVRNAQKALAGE